MKQRHHMNKTGISRRQQLGQSMVEYTIVIAFGILTMSSTPMKNAVASLMATISQNYEGYSFAISISDYPDSDSASDYWDMLEDQSVNKDMRHVLTDKIYKGIGRRRSEEYTTAVEYYRTSPPAVRSTILNEAGNLRNLSIP
jgi:hypothetical protein